MTTGILEGGPNVSFLLHVSSSLVFCTIPQFILDNYMIFTVFCHHTSFWPPQKHVSGLLSMPTANHCLFFEAMGNHHIPSASKGFFVLEVLCE